ncbi:hypothetical protein Tco_0468293 [Tanacetum coccineum]
MNSTMLGLLPLGSFGPSILLHWRNRMLVETCEGYRLGPVRLGKWASIFMIIQLSLVPSKVFFIRHDTSDSEPVISFDISTSPGYVSGLGRASPAKTDLDVYTSMLTQTDLNDLILKYNTPHDLHPWLPLPGFVRSELLDDAIGIYHRMFDYSGIQIPFSTFLLSKGWKIGFFWIDQWPILYYMSWRHPHSAITDPKPPTGSYCQADVRRLSAFVVKLRDMPEGVNAAIPAPTLEDLVAATLNYKVLSKAEYSMKRRASTSGAASSQVAKRTWSATAHSSGSSAWTTLFDDNESNDEESEDDDDACYEILIITC